MPPGAIHRAGHNTLRRLLFAQPTPTSDACGACSGAGDRCIFKLEEMLGRVPCLQARMIKASSCDNNGIGSGSGSEEERLNTFLNACCAVHFDPAEIRELANAMLVSYDDDGEGLVCACVRLCALVCACVRFDTL